jgi:peptide/nickel transport system substrate-binding protein
VGVTDPDLYYTAFHSNMIPPKGANRGFYSNHALDMILDESRVTTDGVRLKSLYQQAQAMVYEDLVYVPLWYENNFVIMGRSVKNYQPRANASYINLVTATKE